MIQRNIGERRWNHFIQKYSFNKLMKQNRELNSFLQENIRYRNIHKGERCFVLGNGPSLNSQDLSLLEKEIVFTCNQIARNPDFKKIKTNYHFWADPIFFRLDESKPEDIELLNTMKNVVTEDNIPQCFFASEAFDFVKKLNLNSQLKISYYHPGLRIHNGFDVDIDFSKLVPSMYTVVQYAILLAIYMGFRGIYLLGCDSTGILTAVKSRINEDCENGYAYEITKNEKNRMLNRNEIISMEQELFGWSEIFKGYRLLNEYCMKRNIKLMNCTSGGVLDCIPRESYLKIISGGKEV